VKGLTGNLRSRLNEALERHEADILRLSSEIYADPELSGEERRASARCTAVLEEAGFAVSPIDGVPTAFVAEKRCTGEGRSVGFLAEYDALPTLGHACGHHLIAASAVGAGLCLAEVADAVPGTIRVYGCPAEETLVGKVQMLEAGVFDGLDFALTFHAHDRTTLMTSSNGLRVFRFEFRGKPSHAGTDPWAGASALDGVLLTYQNVNALRQFIRDGVRIHGIVTHGGDAFNIIPERASCELAVRAVDPEELERVAARVIDCAKAAALASGTELQVQTGVYAAPVRAHPLLAQRMQSTLESLGETVGEWPALASTDFGNVSQRVPGLLFSVETWPRGTAFHTREAAAAAGEPQAYRAMVKGALAMALVGAELLLAGDDNGQEGDG